MTSAAASSSPAGQRHGRPSRPNDRVLSMHRWQPTWISILAIFTCFISHALAAAPEAAAPVETLIIDHRVPYREGERWIMLSEQELQGRRAQKRATSDDSSSSTKSSGSSKTSSTSISVTTTFSIAVGTPSPSSTSTTASESPLPSIFDSLTADLQPGSKGSQNCPNFISSFLSNSTFKQCYPLSMLFDKSKSFFEAQKSLVSITRTLDATCAANATLCTAYMTSLAAQLLSPDNCGAEYQSGKPAIVDTYVAMLAYAPVYGAGCLRDPASGAYCYANAVTNLTNPSTTYLYFLPLNKTLPGATLPACGECLRQTMAVYQAATADRRQLVSNVYVGAAKQINTVCGPGFVNETLAAVAIPSGAGGGVVGMRPGRGVLMGLGLLVPLVLAVL